MKKFLSISFFLLSFTAFTQLQEQVKDTTFTHTYLDEVIVISNLNTKKINTKKQVKPLSSLDEYLEKSSKITMIKRGNYAWEPTINNMVSDRINVTIDGMQIFGACTDKMDPITSYVDTSNLSEAHISSGQQGSENGQTIGGSINLKLDRSNFSEEYSKIITGLDIGFETNSNAKIFGTEANYSSKKFFLNTDIIYRNAKNYFDGNSKEVQFSQFTKYNFSAIAGYKTSKNGTLLGSIIFDKATNVGYPALPMDVSLAKAFISSISYEHKNITSSIQEIEAKIYANSITHVMDDTKRPNVPIHMDMPGWSNTYGFYIKAKSNIKKHQFLYNFNGYYNKSLAEMTMYPADSNEQLMFMLTWPDVRTLYTGFYAEDLYKINTKTNFKFSTRLGFQKNTIADNFGLNSLHIFYPNLSKHKTRFLPSFSALIKHQKNKINYSFSLGYGERAPSVSEGYGNFLYNSFDNFDYIGNPYLKNEKATETSLNINFKNKKLNLTFENSLFYISDYIIGQINTNYNPMVIGADGVKVYNSLDNVIMYNTSLKTAYKLNHNWSLNGFVGYNFGKEINGENLPLIAPISYSTSLHFTKDTFITSLEIKGAGTQHKFSRIYGEDKTKNYTILNYNAGYTFYLNSNKLIMKTGVENIFNTYYSTYSDWKNIPRMGRNVFVNLSFIIK